MVRLSTVPPAEGGGADERGLGGIRVIARAAEILRALGAEPPGLTLSQLAERVGLARSTTHRLLGALEAERLVVLVSRRGAYRVGPELTRLAGAARRAVVLDLHPLLEKLSRDAEETVDLAVLDGDKVTFVDQVVAPQRLRAVSAVGSSFPVYSTANGKAILATLTDDEVVALLPEILDPDTKNTTTRREELLAELADVRRTGVALDREEHTLGICAVGMALRAPDGSPLAVTLVLPAQRFYGREHFLATALLKTRADFETAIEESFGPAS